MLPVVNVIRCDQGQYLLFNTTDFVSTALYLNSGWEPYLIPISKALYSDSPNPLVIDIGANVGAYSIPIAQDIQNRGGSLYAFEPQRIVYYQLCGNAILNRLDNLYAYNFAVGAESGKIGIPELEFQNQTNIGGFSLNPDYRVLQEQEGIKEQISQTEIIKLDDLDLPRMPDVIKMDVEGFEIEVIRGGLSFLERNKFPPILFEAWGKPSYQQQKEELFSLIQSLGYKIQAIVKDNFLAQHPAHRVEIQLQEIRPGNIELSRLR